MTRNIVLLLASAAVACSSATPGARPHDASEASHQQSAKEHDATADAHADQYDPSATREVERCRGLSRGRDFGACWTSATNPTKEHQRTAAEHRRHAAEHRAASEALRQVEAKACSGIAEEDRDNSPFMHVEDIESVSPLTESVAKHPPRQVGAIVKFAAVKGMTTEWLQRVVDCHVARNAALGHVVPDMPNCPLVPKGVSASVSSTDRGFAVSIRGEDAAAQREILARAQRLKK